jgi:hypothetical protein
MESEAKKLVNEVKAMKDGDKILNNLDKLKKLATSPQGKALIATLGQRGAELAERAASDVQKGDVSSAAELLSFLNSTKEGRALMAKIIDMTGM